MTYTFFLGTNTALSQGEIVAVLNRLSISFTIIGATKQLLRLKTQSTLPNGLIKNLGGTIRISEDIATWNTLPSVEEVLEALDPLPAKWDIGLGYMGMSLNIRKLGIELKKAARKKESKLSFIEPKAGFSNKGSDSSLLNAAQVIFNKLTSKPNAELIFITDTEGVVLVRTIAMQDIASYELRDTLRPARDARVGLLPPKLAQIMINLALSKSSKKPSVIYDPFCGMGTLLQEAWLMGIASVGTDISQRMVDSSLENISHLAKNFSVQENLKPIVLQHDVTSSDFPEEVGNKSMTVVTEPFLGTPLSRPLSPTEANDFYQSVAPLYRLFFLNMKSVLQKEARLLVLLPAVRVRENGKDTFTPLPREFLDEIARLGYRKGQLVPKEISSLGTSSTEEPLLYTRPDALIARELTLWERD